MSPRLPSLKAKDIIRCLEQFGFREVRRKGSHRIFQHEDGRSTVVPHHGSEDIGRGLLRAILRESDIPLDDFLKVL